METETTPRRDHTFPEPDVLELVGELRDRVAALEERVEAMAKGPTRIGERP